MLKKKEEEEAALTRCAMRVYVRACHKDDWPVWPSEDRA